MSKLYWKAAQGLLQLPLFVGAFVFLPAGTFDYWQGWVFLAVFFVCSLVITVFLAIKDPALLERRMRVGPIAEKEKTQKIIMIFAGLSFAATIFVPALDHRFGWSEVSVPFVILGNVLIALGYLAVWIVFRENTFGASTIQIAEGHHVISTGPYAVIRHPMYSGGLVMMLGVPLALGSWWGLLTFVPAVASIAWRLLDEEKFLTKNLPGYAEYMNKVRYRLIPYVW